MWKIVNLLDPAGTELKSESEADILSKKFDFADLRHCRFQQFLRFVFTRAIWD